MLSHQANWAEWEASLPLTVWRDQATVDVLVKYLDEFYPNEIVTPEMLNNAILILLEDGQLVGNRPPYTKDALKKMPAAKLQYLMQKYGAALNRVLAGE